MSSTRIAEHVLEILGQDNLWDILDWPDTKRIQTSGKKSENTQFRHITPKFLYHLIEESLNFSGRVLEQFLYQLGTCDEKIKENIETLKGVDFVSPKASFDRLFQGLDPKDIDFRPVLNMAAEFFTHLGVVIMNPGGRKSGTGTPYSVSEFVGEETDNLLQELMEDGEFGVRKQRISKELSFRRDGRFCLLTHAGFVPFDDNGVSPELAHIIPNSVHGKTDTLKCISMFASMDISTITQQLNDLGNVMHMEMNAHWTYDQLKWGIEAREEGGMVKYFFRLTRLTHSKVPGFIALQDGDEIHFGEGSEGYLKKPSPELCNLRLAVARVMKMSAAADIVSKWKEEADNDGGDGIFIASKGDCDMVNAKLFLSGRAAVE